MKPFEKLTDNEIKMVMEAQLHAKMKESDQPVSLEMLHNVWKKWFHIQDMNRIDVVLAVALSQKERGVPLWLIVVAPSGDMKSEQIKCLDDDGLTTKWIHKMTDKTIVNGFPENKKDMYPDLAPKLDNKLMLIEDMAEILQLRSEVKTEVWAQLRTLYDGRAGTATGMGADINYKGLYVTFLGASTPAIDDQILIHQSLGSRELLYRPKEVTDILSLMQRAWYNEDFEETIRPELLAVTQAFLKQKKLSYVTISEDVKGKIMGLALYLTKMRAAAPIDGYTSDLRGAVSPEQPTRVVKQLKRLFVCLKSLDEAYTDEKALEIVREVVESSVIRMRQKVLDTLMDGKTYSTSEIATKLKMGKKPTKQELNILWNMDIIKCEQIETTTPWGETRLIQENWKINPDNNVIKFLEALNRNEVYSADYTMIPKSRLEREIEPYIVSGDLGTTTSLENIDGYCDACRQYKQEIYHRQNEFDLDSQKIENKGYCEPCWKAREESK